MTNFYQLTIHPDDLFAEIPLFNKSQPCALPVKAYLSLKPAGNMAFLKRKQLPFRTRFFSLHNIDESSVYSLFQQHTKRVVVSRVKRYLTDAAQGHEMLWQPPAEEIIELTDIVKPKRRINMNDMANTVALKEQGRTEVNIAQIKQVMRIFLEELALYEDEEILEVVERYKKED